MAEKVICKWCKKEISSKDEIGFLLLMSDPDVCPQCEMDFCGTNDNFDYYCSTKKEKMLAMPCLRCSRTAIHCKECGQELLIKEIKHYQKESALYEVAKGMESRW